MVILAYAALKIARMRATLQVIHTVLWWKLMVITMSSLIDKQINVNSLDKALPKKSSWKKMVHSNNLHIGFYFFGKSYYNIHYQKNIEYYMKKM